MYEMEYVNGTTLFDCIDQEENGGFDEAVTRYFARQIVEGIGHLHNEIQIAHRDIKHENMMLDFSNNCIVKVIDCDLMIDDAGSNGDGTTNTRLGTPGFMSWEIENPNMPYNPKAADVFAIGVLIFCLRTGIPPFEKAVPSRNALAREYI